MWLILAITSYFFLGLSGFIDKYLLGGPLPSPKTYIFYTGLLSLSALLIIPLGIVVSLGFLSPLGSLFIDFSKVFSFPSFTLFLISLAAGISFTIALYTYYKGVEKFEVSRIAPAVGGLVPVFTLFFTFLVSFIPFHLAVFQRGKLSIYHYLAFLFLIFGSLFLSLQKKKLATLSSLKISMISALFFGLYFILIRVVYLFLPFWVGFIWIRICVFIAVLPFLSYPEVRKEIFHRKKGLARQPLAIPLILGKSFGGLGAFLQNGAVFLVPLMYLPLVNSLV